MRKEQKRSQGHRKQETNKMTAREKSSKHGNDMSAEHAHTQATPSHLPDPNLNRAHTDTHRVKSNLTFMI